MITVATLLWDANARSQTFSAMYDETWVEKLWRGFARNLTRPFRFACFTDRDRTFSEPAIGQFRIYSKRPTYADCIQPYEATRYGPMILVGLDTVITGNIDHLADYACTAETLALPRDPYALHRACNGVALIPAGHDFVWTEWDRIGSDMERVRAIEHRFIDDLWPGHVVSFKGHARGKGLGDARIVYFHGLDKPHQLADVPWIAEHWR